MPTLSSSGRRTAAVFAAASALVPLAAGSAHAEAPAAPPKLHGEPGGGLLGGGTYNNSVDLILNWRSSSGHTFWAQHAVFYEEHWNGSGPYLRTPSGQYSNTTPYYGPYRVSPTGVLEWMTSVPTWGAGGSVTQINPWINEQTYPKSVSIRVRAQVGLSTWNGSSWSAPTWHFATPKNPARGYAEGICALN